ncbi:MAG TPA: hypothetical protein VF460_13800 [Burkholderiales bacterium]
MIAARALGFIAAVALGGFAVTAGAGQKELDAYKGGVGKWGCEAKELGSGKMFKATIETTAEFDGNTYVERYTEMKSADHPSPWSAVFIMSYDEDARRWVRNGVDNNGGRNAASSAGWQDKTWTWENDGVNIVVNDKGPKARTFAVDVKDSGKVKRVVEANCKKI